MSEFSKESRMLAQVMRLLPEQSPFHWQIGLLRKLMGGKIPSALDIPTGLGKTSIMTIWLVARSFGAKLPRRLVYIVDRRAVVDQATSEAEDLRDFVQGHPEFAKSIGLKERQSLPISTLRGQHVDNREWLASPATPAIIIGTVDMIGSRLLFEGYGVTRKMRPYHAGMLGMDSLFVLDEAHLVLPFEALLETISENNESFDSTDIEGIKPFQLITLSATGREKSNSFQLPKDDLDPDSAAWQRLSAKKDLSFIDQPEDQDLPEFLASRAWNMGAKMNGSNRVVVFCNRRKTAEDVAAKLGEFKNEEKLECSISMLVGARRVYEREYAFQMLKTEGWISGGKNRPSCPRFLVCTSAGEVGVDVDADHMVSDLVAWERMVQRFGRVNRRGYSDAVIEVVIEKNPSPTSTVEKALAVDESKRSDKQIKAVEQYSEKCDAVKKTVFRRPIEMLPKNGSSYEVSPVALRNLKLSCANNKDESESKQNEATRKNKILKSATTDAPLRPALTLAEVEAWSMTSLSDHSGRPQIGPWLRGWDEQNRPQSKVVWRSWMPPEEHAQLFFEAAPVQVSETLEAETDRVFEWAKKRTEKLFKNIEDKEFSKSPLSMAFLIDSSGQLESPSLNLNELLDKEKSDEIKSLLANKTIIFHSSFGGLNAAGLMDVSVSNPTKTIDQDPPDWLPDIDGAPVVRFRIRKVSSLSDISKESGWFNKQVISLKDEGENNDTDAKFLVVQKWRNDSTMEDDRSILFDQRLDDHQKLAEEIIRDLSESLGLSKPFRDALCFAARNHDEGKDASNWQKAFNAPKEGGPFAKTRGPINQAILAGYRHELVSLLRAEKSPDFNKVDSKWRGVALHSIAAHHGFARPVIGLNGCEDYPPSTLREEIKQIALRFAKLQKQFGPWGLAWIESLLRSADQLASQQNSNADEGS